MPFPELRALGDGLLRAGLAEPVMDRDVLTIQYRTVGELLSDLRNTGATNASADRERGLMGKARYARMADAYPKTADGSLPATLEILSGQAWTPAPEQRRNPSGEVSVALSAVTGLK
jgi:malonyl-CoA O-methyltransferase